MNKKNRRYNSSSVGCSRLFRSAAEEDRMWPPGRLIICVVACAITAILLVVFYSNNCAQKVYSPRTLVLVSIVFRHGERNILEPYKLDPFRDKTFWESGYGQLNNRGKQQMYKLGLNMRTHYSGFLPDTYSNEDLWVRSSPLDRCLMSAGLVLAGLYPPVAPQVWSFDFPWQPIPIHTVLEGEDKLIRMDAPCPRYMKEYNDVFKTPELQELNQKYLSDLQHINKNLGSNFSDIRDTASIHDTLHLEEMRGFSLFNWTKSVYPEKTRDLLMFSHEYLTYTPLLKRLQVGPLLGDITNNMKLKAARRLEPNRKMFLYSAHDSTITSVMRGLGFEARFLVDYGASVIFELHYLGDDFEVQVLYSNDYRFRNFKMLDIPECPSPCRLRDILKILEPVIPTLWEQECQN